MGVKLSPAFNFVQLATSTAEPLNGGLLFTYAAGSSTKLATYQDSLGNSAHTNPIVLNARGETPAPIWLTEGQTYKFVLAPSTDSDPPASPIRSFDNVGGVNDTTTAVDEWKASGLTPTYVSGTTFTLAGDQTTAFHIGRRLKTTNTGGTIYSRIVNSAFGAVTTVTVANESGSLDSGLSAVGYGLVSAANTSAPAIGDEYVCQGRLTLTTGTPVTTSDVTAAETLYFTPFRGNKIDLYDSTGQRWVRYKFSELSLDVPDATQMNDVFIYNNAGTLTLEAVAWSNDTTRATALTTQDGVYVKSGATSRRYLGSFRSTTDGNGQTEDSFAKRWVWNYYNRVERTMRVVEATNTWTYSTATTRQANGSAANQLDLVVGVSEDEVTAEALAVASNDNSTTRTVYTAIGLDSTTTLSGLASLGNVTDAVVFPMSASYRGFPGIGRHFLAWLETGAGAGTQTWYGDNGGTLMQAGIVGSLRG